MNANQARWILCAAALIGCQRVSPYQRETLARPDMQFGSNAALLNGEQHAQAYREGSSGGGEAHGGGCGCN
jgi:hypothetical protein